MNLITRLNALVPSKFEWVKFETNPEKTRAQYRVKAPKDNWYNLYTIKIGIKPSGRVRVCLEKHVQNLVRELYIQYPNYEESLDPYYDEILQIILRDIEK